LKFGSQYRDLRIEKAAGGKKENAGGFNQAHTLLIIAKSMPAHS
jgi:hypothetical protein